MESAQTGVGGSGMTKDLQQVLQFLVEDRQKREEEIVAEQLQHKVEVAVEC